MTLQRALAPALTVATVLFAACLPEGGPGIGTRVLDGRGIGALAFASGPPAGAATVLFARAVRDPEAIDTPTGDGGRARWLYALSPGAAQPRLLVKRFDASTRGLHAVDARGQLWVLHGQRVEAHAPRLSPYQLSRFDLTTGVETPLGTARGLTVTAGGRLVLVQRDYRQIEAHDLDGEVHELKNAHGPYLIAGDQLLFVTPEGLTRIDVPVTGPPRLVVPGVSILWDVAGPAADRQLLVDLGRAAGGPSTEPHKLALVRGFTSAPGEPAPEPRPLVTDRLLGAPAMSPDGERIAVLTHTADERVIKLRVFDLVAGSEESAEHTLAPTSGEPAGPPIDPAPGPGGQPPSAGPNAPTSRARRLGVVFRPGSRELWLFESARLVAIMADGQLRPITGPRRYRLFIDEFAPPMVGGGYTPSNAPVVISTALPDPGGFRTMFTADGRHWTFRENDEDIRLGRADDPSAPALVTLASTMSFAAPVFRQLDDRHLLMAFEHFTDSVDLQIIDREEGRVTALVRGVGDLVIGPQRIVAIAGKISGPSAPGRLATIALPSGAVSYHAENTTEFALPPCAGCEPTAPGSEIHYVVQARFPWAHDGLWKATLP